MEYKKKLVPFTEAEIKILKQSINGSLMLFAVILGGLIMGTHYGGAPFFVPLFLLLVLIGGLVLLYSKSGMVKQDLKEGKKEVIVGIIRERNKRALNSAENDVYYVIGPDKVYTNQYLMEVGDLVEVHRAPNSSYLFDMKKLR